MHKHQHYSGKITLSYQTRAEQLAIDKLFELLDAAPVEDLVFILDGFDARQAAIESPGWGREHEKPTKIKTENREETFDSRRDR